MPDDSEYIDDGFYPSLARAPPPPTPPRGRTSPTHTLFPLHDGRPGPALPHNLLSCMEEKALQRIKFLKSLNLHPRVAWHATSRRSSTMTSRRTCDPRQSTSSAPWGGMPMSSSSSWSTPTRSLCESRRDTRPTRTAGSGCHCQPCSRPRMPSFVPC
jgi:hypothetical protein